MVDYSRWNKIEISDDEDDQHPNIDTASLNKWRHEARVERERKRREEREKCLIEKQEIQRKMEKLKREAETEEVKNKLKELELKKKDIEKKEIEVIEEEKSAPWNVDTISKDGFAKTIINKPIPREDRSKLSEEELSKRYVDHCKTYEKQMKEYAMFSKIDDARRYLKDNLHLVCEETSNYLTIHCLNLAIEGKKDLVKHMARQVVSLNYILELSKHMDIDPRSAVDPFFAKMQKADPEYVSAFEDEIKAFVGRLEVRAQQKIDEAVKEVEEEERQARISQSPGGLDPQEVFESLPEELQECFEKRDIALLQEVIAKMSPEDARYHIKRCVDSGLWVPDESSPLHPNNQKNAESSASATDNKNEEEEVIYDEATSSKE